MVLALPRIQFLNLSAYPINFTWNYIWNHLFSPSCLLAFPLNAFLTHPPLKSFKKQSNHISYPDLKLFNGFSFKMNRTPASFHIFISCHSPLSDVNHKGFLSYLRFVGHLFTASKTFASAYSSEIILPFFHRVNTSNFKIQDTCQLFRKAFLDNPNSLPILIKLFYLLLL